MSRGTISGGAPFVLRIVFADDETIDFTLELTNNDGSVFDVNAVAFEYVVRDAAGSEKFRLGEGSGITKNAALGTVTFKKAVGALPPGRYEHGCRIRTISSGDYAQLFDGPLTIREGQF